LERLRGLRLRRYSPVDLGNRDRREPSFIDGCCVGGVQKRLTFDLVVELARSWLRVSSISLIGACVDLSRFFASITEFGARTIAWALYGLPHPSSPSCNTSDSANTLLLLLLLLLLHTSIFLLLLSGSACFGTPAIIVLASPQPPGEAEKKRDATAAAAAAAAAPAGIEDGSVPAYGRERRKIRSLLHPPSVQGLSTLEKAAIFARSLPGPVLESPRTRPCEHSSTPGRSGDERSFFAKSSLSFLRVTSSLPVVTSVEPLAAVTGKTIYSPTEHSMQQLSEWTGWKCRL